MRITAEQVTIVQTTFAQMGGTDALTQRFYNRLFESDPRTRSMFKEDMAYQRMKLFQTLAVALYSLDDSIIPTIESLDRKHILCDGNIAHWDSVSAVLLESLADHFGDAFTGSVYDAWSAAYGLISGTAIEAVDPAAKNL